MRSHRPLPGDQYPAWQEKRQRQLSEHREGRHGASGDEAGAFAMPRIAAEHLGPLGDDLHAPQVQLLDEGRQGPRLLGDRVDQQP